MKNKTILFLSGFLVCLFILTTIRFITYKEPQHTHYHANFMMLINGKRVDFTAPQYSEEISSCSVDGPLDPKQRVHLHEQNQDVIHIHADGVTWGHFMANLGYGLGDKYLSDTLGHIYQNNEDKSLKTILNGKKVDGVSNRLIKTEDRLLIAYGNESYDDLINNKYKEVSTSAKEFNIKNDPASCSGNVKTGFWTKLKNSIK